jgi:hypothetical protein
MGLSRPINASVRASGDFAFALCGRMQLIGRVQIPDVLKGFICERCRIFAALGGDLDKHVCQHGDAPLGDP